MHITRVVINNYNPKERGICAEAAVVFDDSLMVHKLSIIAGKAGLFVGMPHKGQITVIEGSSKRYEDLVHPLNKQLGKEIQDSVLKAYREYQEQHNK